MFTDSDVKIAGDKPSRDVKRNRALAENTNVDKEKAARAKKWGEEVGLKFIEDAKEAEAAEEMPNLEMILQRRMLLSFTATAGFEQLSPDDSLSGIAQKSFLDTLKKADDELYRTSGDTGAFSFYYLAFRRGGDTERRIGQTFAMLCSHDGDPIYQELGEALYCWFLSIVKQKAEEFNII
ncbi:MAG: hypothetical protein E7565_10060 [Ruminococcaceae bacterium]|nr:hypothetical protein [Oscillospiraceae bacterium]